MHVRVRVCEGDSGVWSFICSGPGHLVIGVAAATLKLTSCDVPERGRGRLPPGRSVKCHGAMATAPVLSRTSRV